MSVLEWGSLSCGSHLVCLKNFIGKCHFGKAIYDFVHHTYLVDFSSAV